MLKNNKILFDVKPDAQINEELILTIAKTGAELAQCRPNGIFD
jgi:hypothetical protein